MAGCKTAGETRLPEEGEAALSGEASPGAESGSSFSFAELSKLVFWFGSGAGGWSTVLTVRDDGTFAGEYRDSDVGSCYLCNFTGTLTEPVQVNDYTYSVKLAQIELAEEPGTEELRDGIHILYSEPYGLDDAEELLFYLPGAPVSELPEEYQGWMTGYGDSIGAQLPFYGLYNVNAGQGFSSHEKASIDDEAACIPQEEAEIQKSGGDA